ncbi:colicin immunity domain-containing protein [Streptomyces sp. NPDC058122]|uniref:colicin immunity domain-containing protein n=1 Tax=Streptomyces sp. NPDC058122 TaxID=3346349 RepID=UPI0036F1694A
MNEAQRQYETERQHMNDSRLVDLVLSGPRSFRPEWLAEGAKRVVPLPSRARMDEHLASRFSAGSRRTGHTYVIASRLSDAAAGRPEIEIPSTQEGLLQQLPWSDENFVVATPDFSGALLVTDEGYSLIGGTLDFLKQSIPEGVDQAIVDFKRYAKRVGPGHPVLAGVANAFQPREAAWASKRDVAAGSATAEQVSLMESLGAGRISAEEFARSWLAARRRALDLRERLREPFSRILDQVFYALDDYVIDPGLRDADDMTDEELQTIVCGHLSELESLDRHGAS